MKKDFDHARLLYEILPAVYRERDESGDLRKYLNGCGLLLDQLHHTLQQRYADLFAQADASYDLDSQSWLLPYMAALLDVKLVSPLQQGKRTEIASAIAWRKAKGTLRVVDEVAEAVGGLEVVVQEGWKRVATTARVGLPLLAPAYYGYSGAAPSEQHAPMAARHPGLPAGTPDLRCPAGAVAASADNGAAFTSRVDGKQFRWRQSSLHGAPHCSEGRSSLPYPGRQPTWLPGTFDDASARTVDFRDPGWRQGHFHPRRALLYAPTHGGFFAANTRRIQWPEDPLHDENLGELVSVVENGAETSFSAKPLESGEIPPVVIRGRVRLGQEDDGTGPVDPRVWRFKNLVFSNTVEADSGRLVFENCAVLAAEVHSIDDQRPVLSARDCLFKRVQTARGLARLEYCTVLSTTLAERLQASDCIFNGQIRRHHDSGSLPGPGCIRFSSVLPQQAQGLCRFYRHQRLSAVFHTAQFGQPGCVVLHPPTPPQISQGAEDGGEMGAYHHLYLSARRRAVGEKLNSFLPTGIKPVLIPDPTLHHLPGEINADASE